VLDCSKKSYPNQWAAERALHAIQESSRSHGERHYGVLLVWPLQGLAPDFEVEEPNSGLGQKETVSRRPPGIGMGSRGY